MPAAAGTLNPTLLAGLTTSTTCSISTDGAVVESASAPLGCEVGSPTDIFPTGPVELGSLATIDVLHLGFDQDETPSPSPFQEFTDLGFYVELDLIQSIRFRHIANDEGFATVDVSFEALLTTDGPPRDGVLVAILYQELDILDAQAELPTMVIDGTPGPPVDSSGGGAGFGAYPVRLGESFQVSFDTSIRLETGAGGGVIVSGGFAGFSLSAHELEDGTPAPDDWIEASQLPRASLSAVPEPSTWVLMLSGLALAFARRRT